MVAKHQKHIISSTFESIWGSLVFVMYALHRANLLWSDLKQDLNLPLDGMVGLIIVLVGKQFPEMVVLFVLRWLKVDYLTRARRKENGKWKKKERWHAQYSPLNLLVAFYLLIIFFMYIGILWGRSYIRMLSSWPIIVIGTR